MKSYLVVWPYESEADAVSYLLSVMRGNFVGVRKSSTAVSVSHGYISWSEDSHTPWRSHLRLFQSGLLALLLPVCVQYRHFVHNNIFPISYREAMPTFPIVKFGGFVFLKKCCSPPSSAEDKGTWSYISTPPYVFMAWPLIKHRMSSWRGV
jgi:hypothetical protein